jgi:hypothetical protein
MDDLRALIEALEKLQQKAVGGDYLFETTFHAEVYEVLDAALAALRATVDGASWTPPEDRPDGYVCLGLVPVTWHGEVMGWRDGVMEQVEPLGFAPAPEDAP